MKIEQLFLNLDLAIGSYRRAVGTILYVGITFGVAPACCGFVSHCSTRFTARAQSRRPTDRR